MSAVKSCLLAGFVAVGSACSHRPPADFAPDPGLLSHIRDIEITVTESAVCPGGIIQASYQAVIDDDTRVPFIRSYDKKHPPRLHSSFITYTSPEASATRDGNWSTSQNPIASAITGFRLTATLNAKPSVHHTIVVPPDYSCMRHGFTFSGREEGNGPDATVRLAMGHSPFYEKLLVVAIAVGDAAPFYTLYDARAIPPASWLTIESRGGPGRNGLPGSHGRDGQAGADGCPPEAGGPGGDGSDGGPGGDGGRGGRISIVVPNEQPFLAGLVIARGLGGSGGSGGDGGRGGSGGKGGRGQTGSDNKQCADAADGVAGRSGAQGMSGGDGRRGPRPVTHTVPAGEVFAPNLPPEIAALLDETGRR